MKQLTDPNNTTLSELSELDGLIALEGDGRGNVRFKGNFGRKK